MRIVLIVAPLVAGLACLSGCYVAREVANVPVDARADSSESPDPAEVDASPDAMSSLDAGDAGDASIGDAGTYCTSFATEVVDHAFGTGQNHNQSMGFPHALFGPPSANAISEVVSLGNGGWIVLAFDGRLILDGPGVDFIVFENPLPSFVELAAVSVSEDGTTWHEFPCTAAQNATDFGACAGVHRVLSSPQNGVSPYDPAVAGGDPYDLATLGVSRARYVRIVDRPDLDGPAGVFDLDAVSVRHASCGP